MPDNEQRQCAADVRREAMEEPSDEPKCRECGDSKLVECLDAGCDTEFCVPCPFCVEPKCPDCDGGGEIEVHHRPLTSNNFESSSIQPCPSCGRETDGQA